MTNTGVSNTVRENVRNAIMRLRSRAQLLDGPRDVREAFSNADDYPDFDEDGSANYDTGYVVGIAEALEMPVADLLDACNVVELI